MSQAGILDVESSNPQIPTSFVTNSGTAVPIGNTIEFLGNSLQGISSSGSGNTVTYTVANATTASKGVASFDPVDFTVVNGNVSFAGSGIGQTVTGNSGGGLSPIAGNWNLVGAGSVTTSGSGNTLTTQLSGLNNHSLLVGAGTTTIGKLAVGTNGQVVIGATGSNPSFATLTSSDSSISFTTGANTLSLQVGTTIGKTITGDSGGALSPTAGNWNILGGTLSAGTNASTTSGSGSTLTITSINTAKWIVDPTANRGTHQTIAAAITAASSGETIFIRPGTYTENITLKAGVNLCAFTCDGSLGSDGASAFTSNVIIVGKVTASFTGYVSMSGIMLKTNNDFCLVASSVGGATLNLEDCFINCINNTGLSVTGAGIKVNLFRCNGDVGTTAIALFAHTAGSLEFFYCSFGNSGGSSTASTSSGTVFLAYNCSFNTPITTSSALSFVVQYTQFAQALILGSTNTQTIDKCVCTGGSSSAISVGTGATLTITHSTISSSNTNAISGLGSVIYAGLIFTSTSSTINTTTQSQSNQDPSATFASANSGATNTLKISNSSNTASSRANVTASVGGTTSEDASFSSIITGGQTWSWGGDNSDADAFVISGNAALGTTNIMRVDTSGRINYPLQTTFSNYLTNATTNVTGDGTAYTIIFNNELSDVGSNYNNTTGVFTAPVTGNYIFSVNVTLASVGAAHTSMLLQLVTTGATFLLANCNPFVNVGGGSTITFSGSVQTPLTASNTVSVLISVFGGTKTIGLSAGNANTAFSGSLLS